MLKYCTVLGYIVLTSSERGAVVELVLQWLKYELVLLLMYKTFDTLPSTLVILMNLHIYVYVGNGL